MNRLLAVWMILGVLLPGMAIGQRARAYVSKKIMTTDEILPLTVEINGPPLSQSPQFPNIWGMKKLGLNREQASGKTRYIQTYQPTRPGIYEIPSIEVRLGGNVVNTLGITIRVDKGRLPLPGAEDSGLSNGQNVDVFLTYELSKTTCRVGEQVRAAIKLWIPREKRTRFKWDDQELIAFAGQLDQDKLWSENQWPLPDKPQEESKNGRGYLTFLINKRFLFPLEAKTYELGGSELFIEQLLTNRRGNRPARYEQIQLSLPTQSLTVESLPDTDISKAESVGEFSLEYYLSKSTFLTGETIPLILSISGNGNIAMLPQPEFTEPEGFLLYDPSSSYQVETEKANLIGTKEFVYELVPAYKGEYSLGPIVFHYFNPALNQYDSIRLAEIPLTVKGEDIPQLLEVDALDNFYRDAFKQENDQPPLRIPFFSVILMICGALSLCVLGWNIFQLFR